MIDDDAAAEPTEKGEQIETLLATPDLASALDSDQFRRFLDQIPIAILVAEMKGDERIVYANPEFEKLAGQTVAEVIGRAWDVLRGNGKLDLATTLGSAILDASDL